MRKIRLIIAATFLITPFVATADLIVVGTELQGATGVSVTTASGTALYDVQFLDGTCASVHSACEIANFTFTSEADALAALQALLDQVFVDGALGNFDSQPNLIRGITSSNLAVVFTAWGRDNVITPRVDIGFVVNDTSILGDFTQGGFETLTKNTADQGAQNWALWTKSSVAVPEPSTLALLGIGLFGIGISRRRKKT